MPQTHRSDIDRLTEVVGKGMAIATGVKVARRGIQDIENAYLRLRGDAVAVITEISRHLREAPADE